MFVIDCIQFLKRYTNQGRQMAEYTEYTCVC